MKKVINVFLAMLVFFVAAKFFPQYIVIPGIEELIITTLLYSVSGWIIVGAILTFLIPAIFGDVGKLLSALLIVTVIIMSTPFELYFIQKFYSGFQIHGGWTYFFMTIALAVFSVKDKDKN